MILEELARHDGREGRKAFVAVRGKIYDLTGSPHWRGGDHKGAHQAGCDLTEELTKAPHVRSVVERFPVVGVLESAPSAAAKSRSGTTALVVAILLGIAVLVIFFRS